MAVGTAKFFAVTGVNKEAIILLAGVLIRAFGLGTIASGARSKVVHVEEPEFLGHSVGIKPVNELVHAHRRLPALVAIHAEQGVGIGAFGINYQPAGELYLCYLIARRIFILIDRLMAGGAEESIGRMLGN